MRRVRRLAYRRVSNDAEELRLDYEPSVTADFALEVRFPASAGMHSITAAFLDQSTEFEGELQPRHNLDELYSYKGGDPSIDYIAVTGPFDTRGLGLTESRRKIFSCHPEDKSAARVSANDCARQILSKLTRLAYRRPVNDADVKPLLAHYATGAKLGGFEEGIRTAVQGLLISPEFLFRVEMDPAGAKPGTVYRSGDFALASRLSFFLWSSLPDEELLQQIGRAHV